MRRLLPATERALNLRLAPLLGPAMSVRSALRFAENSTCLDPPANPRVRQTGHARIAVATHQAAAVDRVNTRATQLASPFGAARLSTLKRGLRGFGLKREQLVGALEPRPGFEFLDNDKDWYWFGASTTRHAFQTGVRKMLAVAGRPLGVDELLEGLARATALKRKRDADLEVPPADVALAMLRRLSWVRVADSGACSLRRGHGPDGLSDVEAKVFSALRSLGGQCSRTELTKRLGEAPHRVPRESLMSVYYRSPILVSRERGVVSLIGWSSTERAEAGAERKKPRPAKR